MKAIVGYFKRQIEEIRDDTALRIYGACLVFGNVLSYYNWRRGNFIPRFIDNTEEPICRPFFETCYKYRFFNTEQVELIFTAFAILSVIGVFLFFQKKTVSAAYWWMIGVNIFRSLIIHMDFRLSMNQHYMLNFVSFAFLLLPYKRDVLRYIVVSFYVGAGALKFNHEWLSGAALYRDPMWIHGKWIPVSCVYALILEMFLVFGMLVKNKWVYWITFFQLFMFHLVSFEVVGPFYPLLMYGILAIFPLTYFMKKPGEEVSLLRSFLSGKQHLTTYSYIGLFVIMQLIPKIMPGDERLTGEGRLFSLNMFDARVVCEGALTLKFHDGTTESIEIPKKFKNRIKCDPVVNLSLARNQCVKHRNDPNFKDLDFYYEARLYSEDKMKPLVDIPDFCSRDIDYKMWRPNDWILKHD